MIGALAQAFLDLVYPPLCLHCRTPLDPGAKIFCTRCLDKLTLVDPAHRCPYCFSGNFLSEKKICPDCVRRPPLMDRVAAVFDYAGPAATLVRHLKYSDKPFLGQGAGAYLAAQFLRLEWPIPDLVVPVPLSFMHLLERGYNQSEILAKALGDILERPMHNLLYRRSGDFSQAGLSHAQRLEMNNQSIELRSKLDLRDKTIVLVDDVMTTGTTLRACAEALLEGCPARIYGLVLCRALG